MPIYLLRAQQWRFRDKGLWAWGDGLARQVGSSTPMGYSADGSLIVLEIKHCPLFEIQKNNVQCTYKINYDSTTARARIPGQSTAGLDNERDMLSSHDLVSAQRLGYFGWDLPCSSMGVLVERLAGIRRFLPSNPVHRFSIFSQL